MSKSNDFVNQLEKKPWKENNNPIWLASSLKFYRNVSNFLFPQKLDESKKKQLLGLISKAAIPSTVFQNPLFLDSSDLVPLEKQFLYDHFLSPESFHEVGSNEGFIIDDSGLFFIQINDKDHIQIQKIDTSCDIEACLNDLILIENDIGKSLNYAFNNRFGFLTSDIYHAGTGFKGHAYLHVPALIHTGKIKEVLNSQLDNVIAYRGMRGEVSDFVGDIITLYNQSTIGLSEEDILNSLRSVSTKIMVAEKTLRSHFDQELEAQIKTKVSRAYGLAFHSYEFNAIESLNALSLCKLGIDLNWISGIDHKTLNNLLFNSNREHLLSLYKNLKQEEVPHKRAELIHESFKNTKLMI